MEPNELALSDVHLYRPYCQDTDTTYKDYKVVKTRLIYTRDPISLTTDGVHDAGVYVDEDGDLVRKPKPDVEVITIEHSLATRLPDVGLQVWQGCLLLCDYILDNSLMFNDKTVLELGGGTGFASIIMATVAKIVICTDNGNDVLSLCQRNVDAHRHLYPDKTVIVRELDWTKEELNTDGEGCYVWAPNDMELFNSLDVIIAADVIYDDGLTDSFFMTIYKLMCKRPGTTIIVALEKRLNFTLSDLEVSCPAYDYYQLCLDHLRSLDDIRCSVSQVTDIKQYFQYDRSKYLVSIQPICVCDNNHELCQTDSIPSHESVLIQDSCPPIFQELWKICCYDLGKGSPIQDSKQNEVDT